MFKFLALGCVAPINQVVTLAILTSHQRGSSPNGAYYLRPWQRPWLIGFKNVEIECHTTHKENSDEKIRVTYSRLTNTQ